MRDKPSVKKDGSSWVLKRPVYGFRVSGEETRHPTLKAALRAVRVPDGGYASTETARTPEHRYLHGTEPTVWPTVIR